MKKRYSLETWKNPVLQAASISFGTNDENDDVVMGMCARDGTVLAAVILGIEEARSLYITLSECIGTGKSQ
jgi:hypothetical protein